MGRAGQAAEGAQGLARSPRKVCDKAADPLLGPLARRPRGARVHDRGRRRRAEAAVTLGHGPELSRAEAGAALVRHLAGRQRDRVRRGHGPDRRRPELRRLRGPGGRRSRAQPHRRQPGGRRRARATARTAATSPSGARRSRASTATASRLVLHDRKSGANRVVDGALGPLGRHLRLGAGRRSRVYGVDRRRGTPARLPHRRRDAASASALTTRQELLGSSHLSRDGRTLVALRQSFVEPPTLVRVDTRERRGHEALARSTTSSSRRSTPARTRASPTRARPGRDDPDVGQLPAGLRSQRSAGRVYLLLHGGPHNGVTDSFTLRWNAQVFSGWGYVTAWHNFHGSSGFGQAFTDSINPDWATCRTRTRSRPRSGWPRSPGSTTTAWPRAAAATADTWRRCCSGASIRFKTLVAHAAVYNLYTHVRARTSGRASSASASYWEKEHGRLYRKMSPHFGAPQLQDADARDPRRARLPRPGQPRPRAVQHAAEQRGVKSRLDPLPGREPLDPEAAELAALVRQTGSG